MAHIMLSEGQREKVIAKPAKYAKSAVNIMLKEMIELGANKLRITAKIVGGAHMFKTVAPKLDIGKKNIETVKKKIS